MFKSTTAGQLATAYCLQDLLVDALTQTANHSHLVSRVAACHRSYRHWRCERDHDWAEPENSCSVRVCPHCARRRALEMAGRVETFVEGRDGLRYAVLAERNSERLADGMASLWLAWTRLRRSKCWKRHVKGCVVVLEVTYNVQDMTWHPHLNVLMEGEYFPFEELRQAWERATRGCGHTSYIRAADAGTVRELIKYVTKLTDLCSDAAVLDEFLSAVDGARLVRTYGTFYGLKVEEDEEDFAGHCPDCGPQVRVSVVDLGYISSRCVSLDANGVLRVARGGRSVRDAIADAISARAPDWRGPRWRPVWADPVAGREPVKLRTVRDEYTERFLPECPPCDSGESSGQAIFGWENA